MHHTTLIVGNDASFALPNPAYSPDAEIHLYVNVQTVLSATGTWITSDNITGNAAALTLSAGRLYNLASNGTVWVTTSTFPRVGNTLAYVGGAAFPSGTSQTIRPQGGFYILPTNTITLSFAYGSNGGFYGQAGISTISNSARLGFIAPNGVITSTYTVNPGEFVES